MSEVELRQVSPKKLPAGKGWGVTVSPGASPGETVQVVTRKGKTWMAILVEEVSPGVWTTEDTVATPGGTRERLERRAERREEWADSRERKADAAMDASRQAVEGIPFGQPILVGHHSERSHRKALQRSQDKAFESLEHDQMMRRHETAASTIRRNLDRSIYDDDVTPRSG